MPVHNYEIGATYAGRVNVETLTTQKENMAPKSRYFPYAETVQTGARTAVSRGGPFVTWSWGFLYADMYNALRLICPGASASVIIRTLGEDGQTYGYYSADMIWPAPDAFEWVALTKGQGYRPFELRFENITVYTP